MNKFIRKTEILKYNTIIEIIMATFSMKIKGLKIDLGLKLEEIEPTLFGKHPVEKHPVYNVLIMVNGLGTRIKYNVDKESFIDDPLLQQNYPNLSSEEHDEVRAQINETYASLVRAKLVFY